MHADPVPPHPRSPLARRWLLLPAAALGAVLLPLLATLPVPFARAQQSGRERVVWEYAQLLANARQTRPAAWITAERAVAGENLEELFRDLAGGRSRERVTAVDILNLVGREGWELVSHSGVEDGAQTWLLKRAAGR